MVSVLLAPVLGQLLQHSFMALKRNDLYRVYSLSALYPSGVWHYSPAFQISSAVILAVLMAVEGLDI